MADEEQDRDWVQPAAQAGAGAASALLGFALGPIGGPPAAAAAQPLLLRAFSQVGRRYREQAEAQGAAVLAEATELLGGDVDDLAERIIGDVRRLQLAGQALAAGTTTTLEDKIRALGRCLASGVADDALVDPELLLVAALTDIEAPHVLVLRHMAEQPRKQRVKFARGDLERELPQAAHVLGPVLATLERHGLIVRDHEEVNRALREISDSGSRFLSSSRQTFRMAPRELLLVTEFGRRLLDRLAPPDAEEPADS